MNLSIENVQKETWGAAAFKTELDIHKARMNSRPESHLNIISEGLYII
jgi:hypothetical protein